MRRPLAATLVPLALLLAAPMPALASGDDVIEDCAFDGSVEGTYTDPEYADALRDLPTDIDEYGDCRAVIRRAQANAAKAREQQRRPKTTPTQPGTGTPSPPGPGAPTPAPTSPRSTTPAPVAPAPAPALTPQSPRLPPAPVVPASAGLPTDGAGVDMPAPLLWMLVLLGVAGAGAGGIAVRNRVRDRSG